jgi:hypothetical protein
MAIGSRPVTGPRCGSLGKLGTSIRGDLIHPRHPATPVPDRLQRDGDKRPAVIVRCRDSSTWFAPRTSRALRTFSMPFAEAGTTSPESSSAMTDCHRSLPNEGMLVIRLGLARAEGVSTWEFDRETGLGLATTGGFISTTIAGLTGGRTRVAHAEVRARVTTFTWSRSSPPRPNQDCQCRNLTSSGAFEAEATSGGYVVQYQLIRSGKCWRALLLPLQQAGSWLRFPSDFLAHAPMQRWPGPLPDCSDGNKVFAIPVCYVGPVTWPSSPVRWRLAGPAANPLRRWTTARSIVFDGGFPPGRLHYWKSASRRLGDKASTRSWNIRCGSFVDVGWRSSRLAVPLRVVGGDRVPPPRRFFQHCHGGDVDGSRKLRKPRCPGFWKAMQPFATEAVGVNYLTASGPGRRRLHS